MSTQGPDIVEEFVKNVTETWTQTPECNEHKGYHRCQCAEDIVRIKPLREWLNRTRGPHGPTNGAQVLLELEAKFKAHMDAKGITMLGSMVDPNSLLKRSVLVMSCLVTVPNKSHYGYLVTYFKDCHITDESFLDKSALSDQDLRRKLKTAGITDMDQLLSDFDEKKWSFCPVVLDRWLLEGLKFENQSLRKRMPFCFRESISGSGGQATVRRVKVHKDFVDDEIMGTLGTPTGTGKFDGCYDLALKSYANSYKREFEAERNAFTGLQNAPGIVKYFGSYTHHDGVELGEPCHYLILELGDKNLYQYFQTQNPPVLAEEIIATWKTISKSAEALKAVHGILFRAKPWNGWHGDVKPANLLFVNNELRLTDFGFFVFADGTVSQKKLLGHTKTYAPPDQESEKLQTFDIWSYGCVLSVAATWFVVGTNGLANFELHRHKACATANPPTISDQFHDGKRVHRDIRDWHDQLRTIMRPSDFVTSQILKLVDERLLLEDPRDRLSSDTLCSELDKIIRCAEEFSKDRSRQSKYQWAIPRMLQRSRDLLVRDSDTALTNATWSNLFENLTPSPEGLKEIERQADNVRLSLLISEIYRKAVQEGCKESLKFTIEGPDGKLETLQLNMPVEAATPGDGSAQHNRETANREDVLSRRFPSLRHTPSSSPRESYRLSNNADSLAVPPSTRQDTFRQPFLYTRTSRNSSAAGSVPDPVPSVGRTGAPSHVAPAPAYLDPTNPYQGSSSSSPPRSPIAPLPTRSGDTQSLGSSFTQERSHSSTQMDIWTLVRSKEVSAPVQISKLLERETEKYLAMSRDSHTGATPLILAAQKPDPSMIDVLLEYSDTCAQDREGKTVLHHLVLARRSIGSPKDAIWDEGYLEVLEKILKSRDGERLLNILDSGGYPALFYCLTEHGTEMLGTMQRLITVETATPIHVRRKVLQEAVNTASLASLELLGGYTKEGDWQTIENPGNLEGKKKGYVKARIPKQATKKEGWIFKHR